MPNEESATAAISRELTAIWSEVIGKPPTSSDANFFEDGGNSLAAMKVMARVRKRYGAELKMRELFEHPSVTDLTHRLHQLKTDHRVSQGDQPDV